MNRKLLSFGILFFILGCGKSFDSDAESTSGKVRMRVIAPGSVSADSAQSLPYSYAEVDLLDVYDLVSLSGRYAQFYIKASSAGNKLSGTQPHGQFFKGKDGIFTPKNFLSLQIATLYYHSQNLMRLESTLDLENKRQVPMKIVLDTPVLNAKQSENNAFYDGDMDAIIYLKYSEGNLPLALNGGVFAHEYFHSIFEREVLRVVKSNKLFEIPSAIHNLSMNQALEKIKKINLNSLAIATEKKLSNGPMALSTENVKWYYALLVKGFNEGLADYWGWAYVNDPAFIGHSLPQTRATRKLDLQAQKLESLQLLSDAEMLSIVYQVSESDSEKLDLINAFSYLLGSRVALFFKSYSDVIKSERNLSEDAAKKEMNALIIKFVKIIAQSLPQVTMAADHTQLIGPYELMHKLIGQQILTTEKECTFLKEFMEKDGEWTNRLECKATEKKFKLMTKDQQ